MPLSRGQALGRAVAIDYNSQISNLQREDMMMRQAKADRQTRIEKETAGIVLPGDFNKWDDGIVKGFVQNRIQEIGAYFNENPDAKSNPDKLFHVNNLIRGLTYDPVIAKAKRIDTEIKAYNDFANSEKSSLWANSPKYQALRTELDNYINFGDINGAEGGGGEFRFRNPGKFVDVDKALITAAQTIQLNGKKNTGDWTKFYATDEDIYGGAKVLMADQGEVGIALKDKFNEEVEAGLIKPDQYQQWISDKLKKHTQIDWKTSPFRQTRTTRDGTTDTARPIIAYQDVINGREPMAKENAESFRNGYDSQNKTLSTEQDLVFYSDGNQIDLTGTKGKQYKVIPTLNTNRYFQKEKVQLWASSNGIKINDDNWKNYIKDYNEYLHQGDALTNEEKELAVEYRVNIPLDYEDPNFDMNVFKSLEKAEILTNLSWWEKWIYAGHNSIDVDVPGNLAHDYEMKLAEGINSDVAQIIKGEDGKSYLQIPASNRHGWSNISQTLHDKKLAATPGKVEYDKEGGSFVIEQDGVLYYADKYGNNIGRVPENKIGNYIQK